MRFLAIFLLAFLPLLDAMTVEELEEKLTGQLDRKMEMQKEFYDKTVKEKLTLYDKEMSQIKAELQKTFEGRLQKLENFVTHNTGVSLNDTEELEVRVSVLEESVAILEAGFVILTDDLDNVESVNILQDQTINIMEAEILDNDNDIEVILSEVDVLEDTTISLGNQVSVLDQRVTVLEFDNTELVERVETLEEMTSQLTDDVSSLEDNDVTQDEKISGTEEDVTSLDQRVEDLESGGAFRDTIFMAALNENVDGFINPVIFDRHVINLGDHYNTTTGKYTVPYDGIYQFFVNIANNGYVRINIHVDDAVTHNDQYANSFTYYRSFSFLQELTAGQTVHVEVDSSGGGANGQTGTLVSYFGGYMILAN